MVTINNPLLFYLSRWSWGSSFQTDMSYRASSGPLRQVCVYRLVYIFVCARFECSFHLASHRYGCNVKSSRGSLLTFMTAATPESWRLKDWDMSLILGIRCTSAQQWHGSLHAEQQFGEKFLLKHELQSTQRLVMVQLVHASADSLSSLFPVGDVRHFVSSHLEDPQLSFHLCKRHLTSL